MSTAADMGNAELLTYIEAANLLGVKYESLGILIARDKLHSVKMPGERRRYFRRTEVEHYAQTRRRARTLVLVVPRLPHLVVEKPPTPPTDEPSGADRRFSQALETFADIATNAAEGAELSALTMGIITAGLLYAGYLYAQGRLSPSEKEELERLAEQAQAAQQPYLFVEELQRRIAA
jgi:excisionase family DNA binding protein